MTGRFEHKLAIEEKLENHIKEKPIWLRDYYYSMANNTAATKRKYLGDVEMFLNSIADGMGVEIAELKLENITTSVINRYFTKRNQELISGKPISNATIATQISSLHNFFDFLYRFEYISENPMEKAIKRPSVKLKDEISYLTEDEISIIIKNLNEGVGSKHARTSQKKYQDRDRLLFLIPLSTGCRVSALSEINVSDIDFENCLIHTIDKRDKEFEYEVTKELMDIIRRWCDKRKLIPGIEATDALFVSKKSDGCKRLGVGAIQKIIAKYSDGIDRKISPHELRRTFGTNVYRMKGDIYLTSELLGHSSPTTTKRYASVNKQEMKEVRGAIINNLLK